MAITFPLTPPASPAPRSARFLMRSVVGFSASPFTGQQQVYAHQGQWWELDITLPPMQRADAEGWIAFLAALNGREGTFTYGPPGAGTARGTATSATVSGGSQTGSTLTVTGSGTLKAGDWLQLGSGSSAHLHKNLTDANLGLGTTLDIWPRLRTSPSNGATVSFASPVGLWRLASNERSWDVNEASFYGLSITCVEAL